MADIAPRDRLIVALDVATADQAMHLVDRLDGQVNFYKVGLELFSSGTGIALIEQLAKRGHKVFADFKFFDVPTTVSRAVHNLNGMGITFLTVHGDHQIMEAAVEATDEISILAVTVLTSMDEASLGAMGVNIDIAELVAMRAQNAKNAGCRGVIASGREAGIIRDQVGADVVIVTPGIRNTGESVNDQKRVASVSKALSAGADYLVVGRPIRDASDPQRAAAGFQDEILRALANN